MCILCVHGKLQKHFTSRRSFLKGTAATGVAAAAIGLFGSSADAQGTMARRRHRPGQAGAMSSATVT